MKHKTDNAVLEKTGTSVDHPEMFKVVMHNDDYTSMDFVVSVLRKIFGKSQQEAEKIMISVHQEGKGIAGVYPYEIAETKVAFSIQLARKHGFPFMLTIEPEK